MAVDGITGSNPILLPGLGNRQEPVARPQRAGDLGPPPATTRTTAPLSNAPVATPAESPQAAALQQNALLVNESLRELAFPKSESTNNLLADAGLPTALTQTRELDPLQQSALLVNTTLQNLGGTSAAPGSPLLINALPPALEASGIIEELDPTRQGVLRVNEVLRDLAALSPANVAGQTTPIARTAPDTVTAARIAPPPQAGDIPLRLTETAATPTPAFAGQTATDTSTSATIPVAARFLTQEFSPATLPLTLFPDRTPYVLAVYQLNDPAPQPHGPEPLGREVVPVAAIAGIRPPGDARLRQLLLQARESGQPESTGYSSRNTMEQAEKSIRYTLGQVNEEMAAHGLPLHLVFAKSENGFALNVYDCSYDEACRLSYDVPVPLDRLAGVLGNLLRETGIIIDTMS